MENLDRNKFVTITQCIYDEARKLNPNMQIDPENQKFITEYGRKLGREFATIKKMNPEEEKAFFANQVDDYVDYFKTMLDFYVLCGEQIPTIETLISEMEDAFCYPEN